MRRCDDAKKKEAKKVKLKLEEGRKEGRKEEKGFVAAPRTSTTPFFACVRPEERESRCLSEIKPL